jgi:hypothetical protein
MNSLHSLRTGEGRVADAAEQDFDLHIALGGPRRGIVIEASGDVSLAAE